MNKNLMTATLAALAFAAAFQTTAKAGDPINPAPGAVCNLYLANVEDIDDYDEVKTFTEFSAALPRQAASDTFVDTAGEFKDREKKDGIESDVAMWTGWLKQEKAGSYTFLCKRGARYTGDFRYSVWINGQKCVEAGEGQKAFNVELHAGFNSVKIITWTAVDIVYPLSITYKMAGSVKEAVPFGPGDMWYDDEE